MRCSRVYVVLFASFVFCQPCITFTTPVQARSLHRHQVVSSVRPHQRVYLLRGFMNVFSLGMDQLAAELRQRGVEAVVGNHSLSDAYASEAAADCKAGRINSIAIVGHSLGAGAGVEMADQLGQAGVGVGLVVTVDPVSRTRSRPMCERWRISTSPAGLDKRSRAPAIFAARCRTSI
jgi:hypothetical protein